jgi:hypothetical protein
MLKSQAQSIESGSDVDESAVSVPALVVEKFLLQLAFKSVMAILHVRVHRSGDLNPSLSIFLEFGYGLVIGRR